MEDSKREIDNEESLEIKWLRTILLFIAFGFLIEKEKEDTQNDNRKETIP